MPLVGDRVKSARLALTAPFAALFVAASSMPPPMHPRGPRARRSLFVRPTSSRPHPLATPLVATLTAAATGRPTSLAATRLLHRSRVVCGRDVSARCGSAVSTCKSIHTPFLERRILQVGVFGGSGVHTI